LEPRLTQSKPPCEAAKGYPSPLHCSPGHGAAKPLKKIFPHGSQFVGYRFVHGEFAVEATVGDDPAVKPRGALGISAMNPQGLPKGKVERLVGVRAHVEVHALFMLLQ
jgi:hypothetical protein